MGAAGLGIQLARLINHIFAEERKFNMNNQIAKQFPVKNIRSRLLLPVLLSSVVACNSGDDNTLPPGAKVSVSPESKSWQIEENRDENGNCVFDPDIYNDQLIVITVFDGQGSPIGKADLTVSLDLAGNTFTGFPVLSLYDDKNSNGVVDGLEELVSDNNDPLFRDKTAEYSGEKMLILRMNLSCQYRGDLSVMSDGYFGSANFEVLATNGAEES